MSSSDQHERMVAYLDGELSAEESALVEQQLAADEEFRQELQGVERAWSALDELPMAVVTDDFARTTMAMVVDAARQDVEAKTMALPVQRRRQRTNFVVAAMLAALLGALMSRVVWQNSNHQLVVDLSVIQNVDLYSQFQDVSFLRELKRQLGENWQAPLRDSDELKGRVDQLQLVSSHADREAWLISIPADDQATLRAKFNRFRELTAEQQATLRSIDEQIATATDRQQLLETMFGFQQWLNDLPPSEQFGYREIATDAERAKKVSRAMRKLASAKRFELNSAQLQELFQKLVPYITQVVRQKNAELIIQQSKREQQIRHGKPRQKHSLFFVFTSAMKNSPEKTKEFYELVADSLPADLAPGFRKLSQKGKKAQVQGWMRQIHAKQGRREEESQTGKRKRPGVITEQELANYFVEELNPTEKERLLALPRDKMQSRLESLYRGRKSQRDRRGPPAQWQGRRPPHQGPPFEGPRAGRFDEGHRPGPPPRGPRRGPREGTRDEFSRPHHRRPPSE